MGKDN